MSRLDRFAPESRGVHQRPHARPVRGRQQLEAVPYQDAVFTGEGHHVGDRGQRHQVEEMEREVG